MNSLKKKKIYNFVKKKFKILLRKKIWEKKAKYLFKKTGSPPLIISIKKTKNNLFITLNDIDNRVLIKSSIRYGFLKQKFDSRRKRKSSDALESFINYFINRVTKKYSVKYLYKLKIKLTKSSYNSFIKKLILNKLRKIWITEVIKINAHNGIKYRKLKRK